MHDKALKIKEKKFAVAPMIDWTNNAYKPNGYFDVRAKSVQLEIQIYPKLSNSVHR